MSDRDTSDYGLTEEDLLEIEFALADDDVRRLATDGKVAKALHRR